MAGFYHFSFGHSTEKSELARVNRHNPCPICGKFDWCGVSENGGFAVCMRVADGARRESRNGGFVHVLEERVYRPAIPIQRKPEPPAPASLERRDVAYGALLAGSTLDARHFADLRRRGLSPEAIERNAYRSLPASPRRMLEVCADLAGDHNPANVPGFYRDDGGRWAMRCERSGFFIPARDTRGRIQGLQIRQDSGTRYIWFSSAGLDGGASSGAPTHFARPWKVAETAEAILTEGPLKADVVAELLDCCAIGVPGVSAFGVHFGAELRATLPKLSTVYVAYDRDWRTNTAVESAMFRLFDSLEDAGLRVEAIEWDGPKGFDDFLTQGVK